MVEVQLGIAEIVEDAIAQTDHPLDAMSLVVGTTDATHLTPHGVVEAARAIGDITDTQISDTALHELTIKAAVNSIRGIDLSESGILRARRIGARNARLRAHIESLRAQRLAEQQHDQGL